jgi:transcriptional regulator with XRE-family HTH domain
VKIGKKIKEMRKLKGFSQEGFASKAGLGFIYFGRVERAIRISPYRISSE